jgi:hypothetical protein
MGHAKLPGIAVADIGACAYGIFKGGAACPGQRIGIAGEHLTGLEMAAALSRALGQEIRYRDISPADYRRLPLVGAAELANMFQFKRDFQAVFCGARSVAECRALNPSLHTFETWLAESVSYFGDLARPFHFFHPTDWIESAFCADAESLFIDTRWTWLYCLAPIHVCRVPLNATHGEGRCES